MVASKTNTSAQRRAKLCFRMLCERCVERKMAPNAERIPSGTLAQPEWGKSYGYGTCNPWSITACTLSDRSMVTIAPTIKIGHEIHSESLFIRNRFKVNPWNCGCYIGPSGIAFFGRSECLSWATRLGTSQPRHSTTDCVADARARARPWHMSPVFTSGNTR